MAAASGDVHPYHLGWRANGDGYDVALAVNRLRASGGRAWRLLSAAGDADTGDYVVELSGAQHDALGRLGVRCSRCSDNLAEGAQRIASPKVRLFAGTASKFPYYAYYALCLLRLGIAYAPCDGATLAQGALDDANLLVLPGGFSTWGIDNAEDVNGADENVRDFLARGGAAIGSCGGAFYLSAGRQGWTGTANAKPLHTHEYLQSGVGVVTLAMADGPLAFGCPPTMEVPYYHGPIYDMLGSGIEVAATFHELTLPGGLAIDNPLDRDKFQRDMAGKPAILIASGKRGRAVLFSPHPEMGDLIRKYIALDGYVRHYLPIRGFVTMRDTLRHYRICDAPSFRLVQNAIDTLMSGQHGTEAWPSPVARRGMASNDDAGHCDIVALCRQQVHALPVFAEGEEGDLLRDVASRVVARLTPASEDLGTVMQQADRLEALSPSWRHLATTLAAHVGAATKPASPPPPSQQLMELELSVALLESWTRTARFELALAEAHER
jgi:CobB/CobQ-like glutamine amidotransferase-like protein